MVTGMLGPMLGPMPSEHLWRGFSTIHFFRRRRKGRGGCDAPVCERRGKQLPVYPTGTAKATSAKECTSLVCCVALVARYARAESVFLVFLCTRISRRVRLEIVKYVSSDRNRYREASRIFPFIARLLMRSRGRRWRGHATARRQAKLHAFRYNVGNRYTHSSTCIG